LRSPYIYGSTTIRRLCIACIEGHPGVGLRVASFPNLNELGFSNFENGAIRIHPENKGFKRLHLNRLSTAAVFLFTLLTRGPDRAGEASPLVNLVLTHVNLEVVRLHHVFGAYKSLPLRPRSWQLCSRLPSTIFPQKICNTYTELKKLVEAVRSRPGGVAKALMTEADGVAVRSF
jgi:hypothetical protein